MYQWKYFGVLIAVVAMGFMQAASRAATPPGGSVHVTVVDANGKAVAGAQVGLIELPLKGAGGKAGKDHSRPAPIATGNTDENGVAVLTGISDGSYGVIARLKGAGHGHERVHVSGSDVNVKITLKAKDGQTGGPDKSAKGTGAPA